MTIKDTIKRIKMGVDRVEYAEGDANNAADAGYLQILNEAIREISELRSWSFMYRENDSIVGPGQSFCGLNSATKELAGRQPLALLSPGTSLENPIEILTRECFKARIRTGYPQITDQNLFCWINWNDYDVVTPGVDTGGKSIRLPARLYQLGEPARYIRCCYYAYPQTFVYIDDPTNQRDGYVMLDRFPEMVIAKAKAIALAGVNDPLVGELNGLFQQKFRDAVRADTYSILPPKLRM